MSFVNVLVCVTLLTLHLVALVGLSEVSHNLYSNCKSRHKECLACESRCRKAPDQTSAQFDGSSCTENERAVQNEEPDENELTNQEQQTGARGWTPLDGVPFWFVTYWATVENKWRMNHPKYEAMGYMRGPITRLNNQYFIAYWEVVRDVDRQPYGCEYGFLPLGSPEMLLDYKHGQITIPTLNISFNPAVWQRHLVAREVEPLSRFVRVYKWAYAFDPEKPEQRFRHYFGISEIPDRKLPTLQTNPNVKDDCEMMVWRRVGNYAKKYEYVTYPLVIDDKEVEANVFEATFKTAPEQYKFEESTMQGSPVVCDDKISYIAYYSWIPKPMVPYWVNTTDPWRSTRRFYVFKLAPHVDLIKEAISIDTGVTLPKYTKYLENNTWIAPDISRPNYQPPWLLVPSTKAPSKQ